MAEKSEFPETKLIKFGKRIGWIFSPLLFVILLIYTFFSAQGLKIDLTTGMVEKTGYVDLKEITESDVFFDNVKVGKTSAVLTTDKTAPNQEPLNIKVQKAGKRTWEKTVKPKEGFVNILYPVMYPNDMKYDYSSFNATATYSAPNPNIFFYEKIEDNRISLYKYNVQRQLFGILIRDEKFFDLSNFVIKTDFLTKVITGSNNLTPELLKSRNIYPSTIGRSIVLAIPGEKAWIIDDSGRATNIPNYIPRSDDQVFWSPNSDYVFIRSGRDIFSVEINTNTVSVIYRSTTANEQIDIQFVTTGAIVYKVTTPSSIDLVENTFQGNNQHIIDIPNVDGIRRNNLKKAYQMIEKLNIILLQTEKNIYAYNLTTYEIKKFNKFDGEEIVYNDMLKQVVVTMNNKAKNQFRSYYLEQDDSKTFAYDFIDKESSPENILGFNYTRNIVLQYPSQIIISDSDGTNTLKYTDGVDLRAILAVKEDRNVVFVFGSDDDKNILNKISIKVARFEN